MKCPFIYIIFHIQDNLLLFLTMTVFAFLNIHLNVMLKIIIHKDVKINLVEFLVIHNYE